MGDMEWIDEILGKNWMAVPPEKRPKDYVEGTYTWQSDAIRAHLTEEKRRSLVEGISIAKEFDYYLGGEDFNEQVNEWLDARIEAALGEKE